MVGDSVAQPVARDMTPVPLRVPALEVVDDDGRVRARLGLGPDGALALELAWDADGRPARRRLLRTARGPGRGPTWQACGHEPRAVDRGRPRRHAGRGPLAGRRAHRGAPARRGRRPPRLARRRDRPGRARADVVAYDRRGFGATPPGDAPFSHLDDLLDVLDGPRGSWATRWAARWRSTRRSSCRSGSPGSCCSPPRSAARPRPRTSTRDIARSSRRSWPPRGRRGGGAARDLAVARRAGAARGPRRRRCARARARDAPRDRGRPARPTTPAQRRRGGGRAWRRSAARRRSPGATPTAGRSRRRPRARGGPPRAARRRRLPRRRAPALARGPAAPSRTSSPVPCGPVPPRGSLGA